jgi:hypothetical protein
MNYRSVVIFGGAQPVMDQDAKTRALRCISEHITPGRWDEVRPPTDQELKATAVIAVPLEEVSAKVRSGGPIDDADDYNLPIWAGVLPFEVSAGTPVVDGRVLDGVLLPRSVVTWRRRITRPAIS